jgi:hypothetical protein
VAGNLRRFIYFPKPPRWIGEPEGSIGAYSCVVGGIEPLALEFVHQNGDAAIRFGTDNVTGAVLTGNQLALKV